MGGGCDSLAAELHLAWHGGHFFGGVEVNRRVGENNLIDVICMLDTDADDSHSATCIMLFMWGAMNLHCRAANLRTGVSYVLYGLPETARAWRDHGATVQWRGRFKAHTAVVRS